MKIPSLCKCQFEVFFFPGPCLLYLWFHFRSLLLTCRFWDGSAHGGLWTCPYTLESIATVNWVLGRTIYPKGYIPEAALAKEKSAEEEKERAITAIKTLEEMEQSQFGKPMPECVRERLDFM